MKWLKKYKIGIEEVHNLNSDGWSLPEISDKYGIPRTTLNRYLHQAGYPIYFNNHKGLVSRAIKRRRKEVFTCVNAWKRALVEKYGHKCMICGYTTIVEAHHIIPRHEGGKSSTENGVLLCPNHHAEAHAELLNLIALLKSGELLGKQETAYQQPSRESSKKWLRKYRARDTEGSTTRDISKEIPQEHQTALIS